MSNNVTTPASAQSPDLTVNTPTLQNMHSRLVALTIAAIGIVYGDIGTSPLYTMKTIFSGEHAVQMNHANIVGVVSMIFWGLMIIVSLKYVTLIMRADNHGEGGIMALMALALTSVGRTTRMHRFLLVIGLAGAALFYGDGVITPAISVLSAVEGLEVAAPSLKAYVVPITVAVLICLYMAQSRGTAGIGRWFGPIMLVWFIALGAMGAINIVQAPEIVTALNPLQAIGFMMRNGWVAFVGLGAVVLAFTGAEALYADMGHFGKMPIRIAWTFLVAPALTLNYLGQGALLIAHPDAVANPFFRQLDQWAVYPLVALATVATVIASQATISGTFSMTHQAISLFAMPRMKVVHTSDYEIGQIYIPLVNWVQMGAVLLAVVGFGSSDSLGAAYGIAVTATMLATTFLTFFVVHRKWRYNLAIALFATAFFIAIDATLFAANTLKLLEGGWFPLLLGGVVLLIMLTWERGREIVSENMRAHVIPVKSFLKNLFLSPPPRVEGTAVYFRPIGEGVPHALLHNLMHNKILHQRVVFLTAEHMPVPVIDDSERVHVVNLEDNCYEVTVKYGFKEDRDIPHALDLCRAQGLEFDMMETSFFVSRQTVVPTAGAGMALWREALFAAMFRNARDAADYYRIPANRVIELGTKLEI
jgi:KUP system potassium uptake protein